MRLGLSFLLLLFLSSFVSCENTPNLEGCWKAIGYTCIERAPDYEVVKIEESNGDLIAIKVVGDNCIQAGDTTWVASKLFFGGYSTKIKGINNYGETKYFDVEMVIQDANTFSVVSDFSTIDFIRDAAECDLH